MKRIVTDTVHLIICSKNTNVIDELPTKILNHRGPGPRRTERLELAHRKLGGHLLVLYPVYPYLILPSEKRSSRAEKLLPPTDGNLPIDYLPSSKDT